jgi:hypothetical protein
MRRAATLAAAFVMLGAATLSAQAANFSGTWTRDTTGMGAMNGGGGGGRQGGGGGGPITITMDAKTMTITRTTPNGEMKTIYNLDGSDSKNTTQGRGGAVEVVSKAKWDGSKLVVTSSQDMNGTAVTRTVTYSLDVGMLVQTTTGPGRDGTAQTTTIKYKKG